MGLAFRVLLVNAALPAFLVWQAWRARNARGRLAWVLQCAAAAELLLFFVIAGNWSLLGYWMRALFPAAFLVVAWRSWRAVRSRPWAGGSRPAIAGWAMVAALAAVALAMAAQGMRLRGHAVQLDFPLRGGVYHVSHGGSARVLNYHQISRPQAYALDIVKLNPLGMRAWGVFPKDLNRYAIYGQTIYAPCSGVVSSAVDGLLDQAPPDGDRDNPPGNHVVLACEGVEVTLAHLMPRSLNVKTGDGVARGDPLGEVGNSGNTSEPHLHIHAERDKAAVPILFSGRFLVRGSLLLR